MINSVTITATASAIAAVILNKAIEKGGENLELIRKENLKREKQCAIFALSR